MVCYSHLSQNFSLFVVIITVKGFSIINEAEVDVFFSGILLLFYGVMNVANLISDSTAFSKSSLYILMFSDHILLKPNLEDFEHTLLVYEMKVIVQYFALYLL